PSHLQTYSAGEAIGRGVAQVLDLIRRIAEGLWTTLTGLVSLRSDAGQVTGVIGIAQLTGEVAQDAGATGLLKLTALLGINLFLINLLPLPALDGGRLLFIFIELLRGGRKLAPEKEGLVHAIGMGLLLLLMAVITVFDTLRLFEGGSILGGP
ncbi:MAG TPA: site-2 protease family protein, partial [Chloroflexia bacterium]|nr:site-2 protease family protein [Chloroflexia bacterium]